MKMKYNYYEFYALCRIAGIAVLRGIPMQITKQQFADQEQFVLKGLHEKNILKNNELTAFGRNCVNLIEKYCSASRHVFLNRIRLAEKGDAFIALKIEEDTINVSYIHKIEVMRDLVNTTPFLRMAHESVTPLNVLFSDNSFEKHIQNENISFVLLKTFQANEEKQQIAYAFSEDECFKFDFTTYVKSRLGAKDTRVDLMTVLRIDT